MRAVEGREDDDRFDAHLSADDWRHLGAVLVRRELQPGDLLLRRGEADTGAFLVERGRLQVFVTGAAPHSHRIATLREGSLIGEPGLFGVVPRMAHVEAMTPCVVWALGLQALQHLQREAPTVAAELLRAAGALMARRARENAERGIPVA